MTIYSKMLVEIAVLILLFLSLIIFDLWPTYTRRLCSKDTLDHYRQKKYKAAQERSVQGLQRLDKAVLILNNVEIDTNVTSAITIKVIAQRMCPHIRQAHSDLTAALRLWENENARQNEEVEDLESSIGDLKRSVFENKAKMEELEENLSLLNNQIEDNERQLEVAYDSHNQAKAALKESETQLRKKKEGKDIAAGTGIVATVAATILGGPFGLLVAGAATATTYLGFEMAVETAQSRVTSAKHNVNSCTDMLSKKQKRKENLDCELSKKKTENKRVKENLIRKKEQLVQLKESQKQSIELSVKLKSTCHVMTTIWGKSRVLHREAECALILEPLLTSLGEIFTMLTPAEQKKLKENTFLLSDDFNFHAISSKLNTICGKADDSVMAILDDLT